MSQFPSIIVADDHPLFRQALIQSLTPNFSGYQWHEANNIAELETLLGSLYCSVRFLILREHRPTLDVPDDAYVRWWYVPSAATVPDSLGNIYVLVGDSHFAPSDC